MQDKQKLISSHSALMLNFSNQNDILRNITAYHSCNRLEIFVEKLQNFLLSIFHWIFYTELFLSRQDFFIIVISHWGEFYLMFFFTIFLQVKIFLKGAEWSREALWRQAIFHGNFPWIFARFFTFFSRIFSVSFLTGLFFVSSPMNKCATQVESFHAVSLSERKKQKIWTASKFEKCGTVKCLQ